MRGIARNVALEMALQQRSVGRRIAQLRMERHLTQEAAADKAGVTLRAYQKWEAGGGIQYSNLQKLAEVFSVPVEQITGDVPTPNPFQIGEHFDGIADEFHARVDAVQQQLDDITARLDRNFAISMELLSYVTQSAEQPAAGVPLVPTELRQLLADASRERPAENPRSKGSRARSRRRAS